MAIFLSDTVYKLKTKSVALMGHSRVHFDAEDSSFFITEGMYTLPQSMTDEEFLVKRKMLTEDEKSFYGDFWDDDEIEVYVTDEDFVFEKWSIDSVEEYVVPAMEIKDIIDML